MEIVLIRHTSVDVVRGTCYGQTDVDVAESFDDEALEVRHKLGKWDSFDIAYSSPLSRAVKLARSVGFDSVELDDRLKEMNMGEWEMKCYDEIDDPHLQDWYADYLHERATGGESFQDLKQRVYDFLDELKAKPFERVAVFAHAGVLVCAGLYAQLFDEDDCFSHQVPYGGIEVIEI